MKGHPSASEFPLEDLDRVGVAARNDLRKKLENMHLAPEISEKRSELAPDDTAADDGYSARQRGPVECVIGSHDADAIDFVTRQAASH
jgi:hypothetical protein